MYINAKEVKRKRLGYRTLGELTAQFMTNPSSLVHRCESDNSRVLTLDPGSINILPSIT